MKYLTGQKIRFTKDDDPFEKGEIATITEVEDDDYQGDIPFMAKVSDKEDWVTEGCFELLETDRQSFKPGDKVKNKRSGKTDIVELVPGMFEYDSRSCLNAANGFSLKDVGWERQENWEKVDEDKPERLHPHCRMAIDHLPIRYESSRGIPVMPSLFKPKRKGGGYMSQLSKLAKKLLDPDTKALVKAGVLDNELEVTEEGVDFVISFLIDQNKVDLAKEARKQLREQKKEEDEE